MAALCLIWLILFNILVNMGFVLSAYTAVRNLPQTEQALQAQTTFGPEKIPHYYEWALTEDKKIIESNMNKKQLKYAYAEHPARFSNSLYRAIVCSAFVIDRLAYRTLYKNSAQRYQCYYKCL